jgi:hypothetical protein
LHDLLHDDDKDDDEYVMGCGHGYITNKQKNNNNLCVLYHYIELLYTMLSVATDITIRGLWWVGSSFTDKIYQVCSYAIWGRQTSPTEQLLLKQARELEHLSDEVKRLRVAMSELDQIKKLDEYKRVCDDIRKLTHENFHDNNNTSGSGVMDDDDLFAHS